MLRVCNSSSIPAANNPVRQRGAALGLESVTGKGISENGVILLFSCIYFNDYPLVISTDTYMRRSYKVSFKNKFGLEQKINLTELLYKQ